MTQFIVKMKMIIILINKMLLIDSNKYSLIIALSISNNLDWKGSVVYDVHWLCW